MSRDHVDDECDAMLRELGLLGPSESSVEEEKLLSKIFSVAYTSFHLLLLLRRPTSDPSLDTSLQAQPAQSSCSFGSSSRDKIATKNLQQGSRSPLTPPLSPGSSGNLTFNLLLPPDVVDNSTSSTSTSNLDWGSTIETPTPPPSEETAIKRKQAELEQGDNLPSTSALGLATTAKKSRWDEPPAPSAQKDVHLQPSINISTTPLPCVSEVESGCQRKLLVESERIQTPFSQEPSSTTGSIEESVAQVTPLQTNLSLVNEVDGNVEDAMDLDPSEEDTVTVSTTPQISPVDQLVPPTPFDGRVRDLIAINGRLYDAQNIIVDVRPPSVISLSPFRF
ncbi:hypothetical protein BDY24DRAFT_372748 [Mrakia frigida]|uniref:uncharacterized protein n=1 Tax=Mrakia frigida TaxID=29902 RepID=UPI003FCC0DD3